MNASLKARIARRPLLAGALAALGLAAAGGAGYEAGLFGTRYPKTPYDDLLDSLPERANAAAIGRAVLAEDRSFGADKIAAALRRKIGNAPLSEAVLRDAERNEVSEVRGWILSTTLAELCALAAWAD